jgi:hypothetical protein
MQTRKEPHGFVEPVLIKRGRFNQGSQHRIDRSELVGRSGTYEACDGSFELGQIVKVSRHPILCGSHGAVCICDVLYGAQYCR